MAVVPQASMRSTLRRVHGLTVSPNFSRNWFQPSSVVKSSFAGRGIYMAQSIKRGSGHANHRNREAVTLALQGRYVLRSGSSDICDSERGEPPRAKAGTARSVSPDVRRTAPDRTGPRAASPFLRQAQAPPHRRHPQPIRSHRLQPSVVRVRGQRRRTAPMSTWPARRQEEGVATSPQCAHEIPCGVLRCCR